LLALRKIGALSCAVERHVHIRRRRTLASMTAFDPTSTYVCLAPDGAASAIEVTPQFWATIGERAELREGRLVSAFHSDGDWPHWEMHPHGDEVLVLLSGQMTMIFDDGGNERSVVLEQGRACIVPRGTWHRATVQAPGVLLAITYGRGTQHRPRQ
jgi:mannose-6-phosphate isomerase-like protein (cupin superfamily)